MNKPYAIDTVSYHAYKNYRYLVYFGQATTAVAGLSKISSGFMHTLAVNKYQQGDKQIFDKGVGRTEYEAVTLERGVTHDSDFEAWANASQKLDRGTPSTSHPHLTREVRIELLDEAGQPVHSYILHGCWVSEFLAVPDLDAGANSIAIAHIKLEYQRWEPGIF